MILKFIRDIRGNDDNINEEMLTEKHWVEIHPNDMTGAPQKLQNPYYFYSVDVNIQQDIDDMIAHLTGSKSGTYKQSLDPSVVNAFKADILAAKSNPIYGKSYTFNSLLSPLNPNAPNILSLRDRDLRAEANAEVVAGSAKALCGQYKVLVHHINEKEYDNDINNLIVIDYANGSTVNNPKALADAAHFVMHNLAKSGGAKNAMIAGPVQYQTQLRFTDPTTPGNIITKTVKLEII